MNSFRTGLLTSRPALINVIIILFLIVAPHETWSQASQGIWYDSDSSGMKYNTSEGPNEAGWSLLQYVKESTEHTEIYENGLPIKSWARTYDTQGRLEREALTQDGMIREELLYDKDGFPSLERRYNENGAVEDTKYTYASGRLVSKTVSLDGLTVKVISYLYAPDGRLASARESPGGYFATSSTMRGISYSWKMSDGFVELSGYDSSGRLVSVSLYSGSELKRHEVRTWNNGLIERVLLTEGTGVITETEYETQGAATGKPRLIQTGLKGDLKTTERRLYDDEGRVAKLELISGQSESSTEYEYDQDGNLLLQNMSQNGILVSVTRYVSTTSRIEESYENGVMFARVNFEDGRKVLEEIFKDGLVVRSRSFE